MKMLEKSESVKLFEVCVCSQHNERPWKITFEASGHTHAYQKAKSIHNVTVLSTRQVSVGSVYH